MINLLNIVVSVADFIWEAKNVGEREKTLQEEKFIRARAFSCAACMPGGSCANVMRTRKASGGGFEDESIIAYILRETAKAVKYFHDNMQIHRDLKAGNILLSSEA
eukprot:6066093-Amphidinium_carterae.1